mgnify:CR=1 FL=1
MMPARWFRPGCRHIFTLLALLCIAPASVAAQSYVTLRGRVSETVALSVAQLRSTLCPLLIVVAEAVKVATTTVTVAEAVAGFPTVPVAVIVYVVVCVPIKVAEPDSAVPLGSSSRIDGEMLTDLAFAELHVSV